MKTTNVKAFGTKAADAPLNEMTIARREVTAKDIEIEILYCGVCHSDLHTARNDWGWTVYPSVPGHEIVGRVTQVGSEVTKLKVGDIAGVGCLVDSCQTCESCKKDREQYCLNGWVGTYGGVDKHLGGQTFGGYSEKIVVDEHFVLKVPAHLDLAAVAPLLCAGITTWSPLRHWNVTKGSKVAVVGLGGLGHMGVKFAVSMGAEVTMLSHSPSKEKDAQRLGAHKFVLTSDEAQAKSVSGYFDFILDTVSAQHDYNFYLGMLKTNGTMVCVGVPPAPTPVHSMSLIFGRKSLGGSLIGGLPETQEMLDYCAEHNIVSDIEMIRMDQINEAYERMLKGDVRYRFVIDMSSL